MKITKRSVSLSETASDPVITPFLSPYHADFIGSTQRDGGIKQPF